MKQDERVGKLKRKPEPKCPGCEHYLRKEFGVYICPNCKSIYEVKK